MSGPPDEPSTTAGASVLVLDLRGVPCPLSWARARVRLECLAPGTLVDILLDDARGVRDLPRAAEAAGHHVSGIEALEATRGWRIHLEV